MDCLDKLIVETVRIESTDRKGFKFCLDAHLDPCDCPRVEPFAKSLELSHFNLLQELTDFKHCPIRCYYSSACLSVCIDLNTRSERSTAQRIFLQSLLLSHFDLLDCVLFFVLLHDQIDYLAYSLTICCHHAAQIIHWIWFAHICWGYPGSGTLASALLSLWFRSATASTHYSWLDIILIHYYYFSSI